MDLTSLFSSLLSAQITKATSYISTHVEGVKKGNAFTNSAAGQLLTDVLTTSATSALQKQLSNDALAKKIGVLTTEEGISAVVAKAVASHPTLDLSQKDAVTAFLQSKL